MCKWTIGGIVCRCSLLFPAVLLLLLLLDKSGLLCYGVLAALLHECGHVAAMLCVRQKPASVTISFYGMRIEWGGMCVDSSLRYGFVALAGPLVNLICATFLQGDGEEVYRALHLGLALFNLLPVFPLDGAEILKALFGFSAFGRRIAECIEWGMYGGLLFLGLALLSTKEPNPTLLFTSLYLIILRLFYKRNCNV